MVIAREVGYGQIPSEKIKVIIKAEKLALPSWLILGARSFQGLARVLIVAQLDC